MFRMHSILSIVPVFSHQFVLVLEVVRSGLYYTFRDIVMWNVMRKCKIWGSRGGLLAFLLLRRTHENVDLSADSIQQMSTNVHAYLLNPRTSIVVE